MNQALVDEIEPEVLDIIPECIASWLENAECALKFEKPFAIRVCFPEAAELYYKQKCAPHELLIMVMKSHEYRIKDIRDRLIEIWETNFIPIELVQAGGCLFYALPRRAFEENKIRDFSLVDMEN